MGGRDIGNRLSSTANLGGAIYRDDDETCALPTLRALGSQPKAMRADWLRVGSPLLALPSLG